MSDSNNISNANGAAATPRSSEQIRSELRNLESASTPMDMLILIAVAVGAPVVAWLITQATHIIFKPLWAFVVFVVIGAVYMAVQIPKERRKKIDELRAELAEAEREGR
ncbi:hypothetical protein [Bifidobacterium jacchi]|uniref:Uncharacterized protein n=1 Tax=Bifidobacterium jacchi TaxID=2490545 RepID=A0A5N5RK06_9BIFI|nr:hypothetical protein [Bifidobacterium jacchi]KAB5607642.1 hypothetical protein EHS19_04070 [Bifidobacterium jacchi]